MRKATNEREFCRTILELARKHGASYADVRIVEQESEYIQLRTGKVETLRNNTSMGFGVRVIANGVWGFASSPAIDMAEAERVVRQAIDIAGASAMVKKKDVALVPVQAFQGETESPCEIDPFGIVLSDKIELLRECDALLRKNQRVKVTECSMVFWRTRTVFANSEGSYIEQLKTESGAGYAATAIEGSEVQTRSYPCSFGGDYASAGYEYVMGMDLAAHTERIADEAVALLFAPTCPTGKQTLIIEGSMLALQVHESCGHPVELDRVLGTESSFAGTSFLTPEKLGNFRYGSDIVNLVADATLTDGMGGFYFDDEGVPAQSIDLVKNGIFQGYLSSRETAADIGLPSSGGAMRADGWNRIPLIRMTNINLLPGTWDFDDLIEDTEDGIYAANVKSWSIDDKRLNFQFGTEIAWEIKDGVMGKILKNPIYSGNTPEFWQSCDAICNEKYWRLWGVPNCGKGEPMQAMHVGHGVAPARFRGVKMEGAK